MNTISRSSFLKTLGISAASLVVPGSVYARIEPTQDKPPQINPEIVKEFVGVSHSKIDRVKEMLENNPLLLHVSYDWGGGDFESGIEAAGHVGNKEIANYLLSKGARYNVYLASMLGHIEVVKLVLGTNPGLLNSKGPHGFTMLHHAKKGEANDVIAFLESVGAKETRMDFYAVSPK
ncbi:MAG TPA: hypothetical protein VD927_05435 [Chryseosolibacter sp.]|nr:hypothetical protein [Chryseosolibacter sp.]